MRNIFYLPILLLLPFLVKGQSQGQNYVKTRTYVKASSGAISSYDTIINVDYYDGLGRPIQNVAFQAGGSRKDIVTPIVYEPGGRQSRQYLPYVTQSSMTQPTQLYRDNTLIVNGINNLYQDLYPGELSSTTPNPYSETFYDNSPLNRVVEKAAPGETWKGNPNADTDHTIKYSYGTNKWFEVYRFEVIFPTGNTEEPELTAIGYYEPWELYKTTVKDENWNPQQTYLKDKTTEEFKDREGRVVLKRTYNKNQHHDTYYVYDKYSNLTYVIPPLASANIVVGPPPPIFAGVNYPWTQLALVDSRLADEYERELQSYDNATILNLDLIEKYGGQGGFSILPSSKGIIVGLNFTVDEPMELRTGSLVDLKEFGDFADMELGRIEGADYSYVFSVQQNNLVVEGSGKVPSLNLDLTGDSLLEHNKNYPWTSLCAVDAQVIADYEGKIKNEENSKILNTYYDNPYQAMGGIAVSLDTDNALSLSINISSQQALSFREGVAFPLGITRRLSNRELGVITGNGYNYILSLRDNSIFITGSGSFTDLIFNITLNQIQPDFQIRTQALEGLCYIYHYDSRNRVVEKKIPGKGWEYMIYDKLDRLIMAQDDKMKLGTQGNKWLFTKYDKFNRIAYTGHVKNIATREVIQAAVNSQTNPVWHEERTTSTFSGGGVNVYYTSNTFPKNTSSAFTVLTVNYFDDYNALTGHTLPSTVYGEARTTITKTLPTLSQIRVLDTADPNKWILSVMAYDKKARPIYAYTYDNYLNYKHTVLSKLDFTGKVLEAETTLSKLVASSWVNTKFKDFFTYDHMGRPLKHTQQQTGKTHIELISQNIYDHLGQLASTNVGGAENAPAVLQSMDYTYNIRGWLKSINNPDASLTDDLFAFKVNYNTAELPQSTALYNGNIAETHWRSGTDNRRRSYKYKYDALNRLTDANYERLYTLATNPSFTEDYTEGSITYDSNGNILRLKRYGLVNVSGVDKIDIIDDLAYTYESYSNRLRKVIDNGSTTEGFKNGTSGSADDYAYDENGNMDKDANKGIATNGITYNHLNLPVTVVLGSNETINYIYSATGTKLKKIVNNQGQVTTTEYNGGFVYEKSGAGANTFQFFPMEQGYVYKDGTGNFSYVYQYKDHLGNVRLSYTDVNRNGAITNSEIREENHYYAFGLQHKGYNAVVNSIGNAKAQNWKYNGIELEKTIGYSIYEMHFRQYDPAIARWNVIDPVVHYDFSPYNSFDNNPVFWADPSGADATFYSNGVEFDGDDAGAAYLAFLNYMDTGSGSFTLSGGVWDMTAVELLPALEIDAYLIKEGPNAGNYGYNLKPYVANHIYMHSSVHAYLREKWFKDSVHKTLDLIGSIDPTGIADAANAIMYAVEGNYAMAAISAVAILPFGDLAKGGKYLAKAGGNRVFWSGGKEAMDAAADYAKANGLKTLEMTRAGQNLEKLINSRNIPWEEARPMWARLSATYAKGAKGNAHFFGGVNVSPGSIWMTVEKPILQNNGTNIINH